MMGVTTSKSKDINADVGRIEKINNKDENYNKHKTVLPPESIENDTTAEITKFNKEKTNEQQEGEKNNGECAKFFLSQEYDVEDSIRTLSSSEDTEEEVPKLNEEQINEDEKEEKGNGECIKLVLPPEYDENDSRWTLKYREAAPGLVELIEQSGVYVNAEKLAECQKWSYDSKRFAQMLLTEIFTSSALSTCSWAGAAANASEIGGPARPGLDEHARNVLLKFVEEYGLLRDWNITDYQCLLNSMRQIILDTKRVKPKKEKRQKMKPDKPDDGEIVKEKECTRGWFLPPEYDENDSRWTLKYRDPAPGLVELLPLSSVYVESDRLTYCNRVAGDCKTLAMLLLREVFTETALRTCEWRDERSNDLTLFFKPGIDKNARNVLVQYVVQVGEMRNGVKPDVDMIEACIRHTMLSLKKRTVSAYYIFK